MALLLAMQKVEGSNPFSRSPESSHLRGFPRPEPDLETPASAIHELAPFGVSDAEGLSHPAPQASRDSS
jgi:hypothetical protein